MYADTTVKIPSDKGKITRKTIKGTTYIYYQISRTYDAAKKYSVPKSTPVGKQCEDDADRMYPNEKYLLYCPDAEMPEEKKASSRSACLRVGAYMVLRKIIAEYRLDEMLNSVIGVKSRKACLDSLLPYIYDLITDISSGAEFYRIREQSSELQDFDHIDVIKQMGPPPAVRAKTNRMNPAGIPYLYLASDIDTAIKECRLSPSKKALCAKYRTKDNLLQILDLSRMDYFTAGSIFSGEYSHDDRWANQFLRGFEREIVNAP